MEIDATSSLGECLREWLGEPFASEAMQGLPETGPGVTYCFRTPKLEIMHLGRGADNFLPIQARELANAESSWLEIIHPDDQAIVAAARDAAQECAGPLRYRIANGQGGWRAIQDWGQPARDSENRIIGYIGRIVDDAAQDLLVDARSENAWRHLASVITRRFMHDFNNIIAGIYSLSELYAMPESEASSMQEAMTHIRDSSIRARDVTQRIRELHAMNPRAASYVEIGGLVKNLEVYLRCVTPKETRFSIDLSGASLTAELDENHLKRCLLHLTSLCREDPLPGATLSLRCQANEDDQQATLLLEGNAAGLPAPEQERDASVASDTKATLDCLERFAQELGGSLTIDLGNSGVSIALRLPLVDLAKTLGDANQAEAGTDPQAPTKGDARAILIYTWEDVTRHPLLNELREQNWKYRIHLDPDQLMLDARELDGQCDGILLFKSVLDEKADPLIATLQQSEAKAKLALIAVDENIESLSSTLNDDCVFVAKASERPAGLVAKLADHFA